MFHAVDEGVTRCWGRGSDGSTSRDITPKSSDVRVALAFVVGTQALCIR